MIKKHNLEVFNHKFNDINGGSSQYFICHKNSKFKVNKKRIQKIINLEKKLKLTDVSAYKKVVSN